MVYCNVDHFHSMKLKYAMLYMMLFILVLCLIAFII